jgi:hypothetical protein
MPRSHSVEGIRHRWVLTVGVAASMQGAVGGPGRVQLVDITIHFRRWNRGLSIALHWSYTYRWSMHAATAFWQVASLVQTLQWHTTWWRRHGPDSDRHCGLNNDAVTQTTQFAWTLHPRQGGIRYLGNIFSVLSILRERQFQLHVSMPIYKSCSFWCPRS